MSARSEALASERGQGPGPMKYVVCIPDGCADEPFDGLGGRTPLEVANTPILDALAARSTLGRAAVIPDGFPPGSDVGNMSIFGFDPARFHTGRAPIEAAAIGLRLGRDQVAYRCNLVTLGEDGTMVDFAGGHPRQDLAERLIARLDERLGAGTGAPIAFHPGVNYRHILVAPTEWSDAECVPPHDLTGEPAVWPEGPSAGLVRDLIDRSATVIADALDEWGETSAVTHIWLWGQGPQPVMERFADRFGVRAGLVTAVDLVRGLGVLADIEIAAVEGATGWYDTNYEAKRDAAIDALVGGRVDLFFVHIEATDEAGHAGDAAEKVAALENWDSRVLAGLVDALDAAGPWRMLLLPDHATPLRTRTHSSDPVPYLLFDSRHDGSGGVYTEAGVSDCSPEPGHELMARLVEPSR